MNKIYFPNKKYDTYSYLHDSFYSSDRHDNIDYIKEHIKLIIGYALNNQSISMQAIFNVPTKITVTVKILEYIGYSPSSMQGTHVNWQISYSSKLSAGDELVLSDMNKDYTMIEHNNTKQRYYKDVVYAAKANKAQSMLLLKNNMNLVQAVITAFKIFGKNFQCELIDKTNEYELLKFVDIITPDKNETFRCVQKLISLGVFKYNELHNQIDEHNRTIREMMANSENINDIIEYHNTALESYDLEC